QGSPNGGGRYAWHMGDRAAGTGLPWSHGLRTARRDLVLLHARGRDVGALLEREIREQALELSGSIAITPAQVDEATRRGIHPLLLRSESIASSRIERVDASGRDVSYAQLDEQQDHLRNHEALSVARNV